MIALNQAAAWQFLFRALGSHQFHLGIEFTCAIHAIAAKEEALKWGQF